MSHLPSPASTPCVHLVCGALGAGKSTHAKCISSANNAVSFATDEWMQELFAPDQPSPINWPWVLERVLRCERRIIAVALQVLRTGGDVVLELGLMRTSDRTRVLAAFRDSGYALKVYWIKASSEVRRSRVAARNVQRGDTHSFDVTPAMFDAIERLYEPPNSEELRGGIVIDGE